MNFLFTFSLFFSLLFFFSLLEGGFAGNGVFYVNEFYYKASQLSER